jgi:ribosomal protein L35AE/L33A
MPAHWRAFAGMEEAPGQGFKPLVEKLVFWINVDNVMAGKIVVNHDRSGASKMSSMCWL